MQTFYVFMGAFAVSQILLSLAKILSLKNLHISELLFSIFLICIGVYLTQPLLISDQYNNPRFLVLIWQHLPTVIPALFLFYCITIFSDELNLKPIYLLGALLSFVPPLILDVLSLEGEIFHIALSTIPQGIEFILMGAGFWIVGASWKNDLVEKRRRFRIMVMACAGGIIFVVIIAQQLSNLSEQQIDLLHYPIAAIFLVCINIFLLDLNKEAVITLTSKQTQLSNIQTQHAPSNSDSKEFQKLESLMSDERIFLDEALTIRVLATQLDLPEYKTRVLINQSLGYRNFNEFLNHYRVQEACLRLSNSSDSVTQIANDIGYNAISAFNRAFKDIHAQTPSEYRKGIKK